MQLILPLAMGAFLSLASSHAFDREIRDVEPISDTNTVCSPVMRFIAFPTTEVRDIATVGHRGLEIELEERILPYSPLPPCCMWYLNHWKRVFAGVCIVGGISLLITSVTILELEQSREIA